MDAKNYLRILGLCLVLVFFELSDSRAQRLSLLQCNLNFLALKAQHALEVDAILLADFLELLLNSIVKLALNEAKTLLVSPTADISERRQSQNLLATSLILNLGTCLL